MRGPCGADPEEIQLTVGWRKFCLPFLTIVSSLEPEEILDGISLTQHVLVAEESIIL